MRTPAIRVAAILLAGLGVCVAAQSGRPAAQLAPFPAPDAASIHVKVVDDGTGKPIVGARLVVNGRQPARGVTEGPDRAMPEMITDRSGEALLAGVAPGRICIVATRVGYEGPPCNWTDPTDPRSIELAANDYRDHVVIRLVRAGGVTGQVSDELGDPVVGLEVTAFRREWGVDGPTFGPAATTLTDDTGTYRIPGLLAGAYLVGFIPHYEESAETAESPDDSDPTISPPLRPATFELGGRRITAVDVASPVPPPETREHTNVVYGPTFAPGIGAREATLVALGPGEWKTTIDIRLQPATLVRVEGHLVPPSGVALNGGRVFLVPSGTSSPIVNREYYMPHVWADGAFLIPFIPPGTYTVLAQAVPQSSKAASVASTIPRLSAVSQITIDERPIQSIAFPVQPDSGVTGRVVVASGQPAPPGLRGFSVLMVSSEHGLEQAMGFLTAPDGTFSVPALAGGSWEFRVSGQPTLALASVSANGRDLPDGLFRQTAGQAASDLVLTLTDQLPSVSGTVESGTAHVDPADWVVAFAADRSAWTPRSRRVLAQHPSATGAFEFKNLPAGTYFIAAAPLEAESWRDAATLESLVPSAVQVSLDEGDHKTVVVRVAKIGGSPQ